VGTHSQSKRAKFELKGPAYVIKVKASSMATKPKVLLGSFILERDIQDSFLTDGSVAQFLLKLESTPSCGKCCWILTQERLAFRRKSL
jgi:hypothetical protein